ncbi:hypothetical protein AB0B50_20880 [Streptomyces sp. NPDC041068]|uniref:hypothetical protein n=1 Tax=Streptomyces sp. NPDC041068 TaxID=3155130 RepID=UPI0033E59C2B
MDNPSASSSLAGLGAPAALDAEQDGATVRTLRRVLTLDAVGMAVVGVGYLAAAAPLSDLFGPGAALVAGVGGAMLAAGVGIGAVARRRRLTAGAVRGVIGGGAFWILLSLATLAFGWLELTTAGLLWTWLQIAPVAVFATWQTLVLRAHLRSTS